VPERRNFFRRGFHLLTSLFVVYWWLPERVVQIDLTRQEIALVGLALLACFEAYRIHKGWLFFGLRDYERKRVAGYFWGAAGYVLALLFFEQRFAMIAILGTTLVDPVLGEMRNRDLKRWAPPAGFAAWCAVALACVFLVPLATPLLLVPLGAAIAVAGESLRVPFVDDNFVMNIAPLLSLTAVAAALGL
jgi:dolichol kinase